ncbi:MAG TPA: TonB-dependent receptor [Lentimicrobium sp.]|nr:TonB-dependent receptor [Lentimicrobium sp.]
MLLKLTTTMLDYFWKLTLLFYLFLLSFAVNAQQNRPQGQPGNGNGQPYGIITGAVHDESTGEHVEYANVVLFKQKDSLMVTGTITDNRGRFILKNLNPGKYYLVIQFIGFENKEIGDLVISPGSADIKLNELTLKPKASSLQGVEITSERALITNNLDKKVITVDKSMALGGGTATDVMENVPSVTVDAEGNVSLRGNSNITLLVDGKPASQAGLAASDLLNQIPASSIESVEVITNPSVRYDPDGTTGIINIVLKKKTLQGFNGLVSLNAGTGNKYNGSLVLNYRGEKFNAFVNFDGRKHNMERSSESTRTSFGDINNILTQSESGEMHRNMSRISGGFDYFIDTRNNITVSVAKRDMSFGGDGLIINRSVENGNLLRLFNRDNESERDIDSYEYTLSYKHLYPQKGREFTNDIIYNDNKMDGTSFINQYSFDVVSQLPIYDTLRQQSIADNAHKVLTIQGNYVYPMQNGSRIEAGYKADIKDIRMNYDYMNFIGDEWISDDNLRNVYNYNEQIYAIYGIYANSWKKLKYQAGLRMEQVFTDSKIDQFDLENSDTTFKTDYTSLYPSLHFQYELVKNKELQLSYSRRVQRPGPWEMNPYIDYSDSLNIRTGNPELKPEFTNSIELGLLQYWGNNSVTASIFYRNTNDVVERITTLISEGVTLTKPLNINKEEHYGLELVGNANPFKWLRTNANVSFYQANMSALPEYNIEGSKRFSWTARLNMSFGLWKDGLFQLVGNYNSPRRTIQELDEARYFADASFKQDFMKKKLSVSLRLTDIFNSRKFDETVYGNDFTTVSSRRNESRILFFGIQYQINNFNKKGNRENNGNGDEGIEMEGF